MIDSLDFLQVPGQFLQNLPLFWTFTLLMVRYLALLLVIPGIGLANRGMFLQIPAAFVLAAASLSSSARAVIPDNAVMLFVQAGSEYLLGSLLGFIPLLIVSGVQTAGHLASSTMGLGGSQLFDPTAGGPISDISRVYGDLATVVFLLLGGHLVIVHAAAGFGGAVVPGSFFPSDATMEMLIQRSGDVFATGTMLSAPVVVALLLTQFVMGLISKAVPTVNIFVVSFPLTIGIGLVLITMGLPEIIRIVAGQVNGMDTALQAITIDSARP